MADKEDTWSWWDALKAGAGAVLVGWGSNAVYRQHRAGQRNRIVKARVLAGPGLKRVSETQEALAKKTKEFSERKSAVQDAYGEYAEAVHAADALGAWLPGERARVSNVGEEYVRESMAPYAQDIAKFRRAGIAPSSEFLGNVKKVREEVTKSAAEKVGQAYAKLDARELRAGKRIVKAEDVWHKASLELDSARQEVAKLQGYLSDPVGTLFPAGSMTAKHLRDYYALRRSYYRPNGARYGYEGIPSNMPFWEAFEGAGANLREPSVASRVNTPKSGKKSEVKHTDEWMERRQKNHGLVQGPLERVAKIAASFVVPGYNVKPAKVRKDADGTERPPTRLDRAQNWVAGHKWPQRISESALGLTIAGFIGNGVNTYYRKKEQKEGVEARAKQERNELMAGFTNVVQTAAAVPQAAMYGREGLHAVVAGVAAARGLGDAGAADKLLARIPSEVLYSHGLKSFDRTPADVRDAMGFGGKAALDLSDEEMHEFARRDLSGLADQYLNSWTNPVPASAEGGL